MPETLIESIRGGDCLRLEADLPQRTALLKDEYAHLVANADALCAKLALLRSLHGRERIASWQALAKAGRVEELVADLLERHYDPAYRRSTERNFIRFGAAQSFPSPASERRSSPTWRGVWRRKARVAAVL